MFIYVAGNKAGDCEIPLYLFSVVMEMQNLTDELQSDSDTSEDL